MPVADKVRVGLIGCGNISPMYFKWCRFFEILDVVACADLDLDLIGEVRDTWQFFRDRRPDSYGPLTED